MAVHITESSSPNPHQAAIAVTAVIGRSAPTAADGRPAPQAALAVGIAQLVHFC